MNGLRLELNQTPQYVIAIQQGVLGFDFACTNVPKTSLEEALGRAVVDCGAEFYAHFIVKGGEANFSIRPGLTWLPHCVEQRGIGFTFGAVVEEDVSYDARRYALLPKADGYDLPRLHSWLTEEYGGERSRRKSSPDLKLVGDMDAMPIDVSSTSGTEQLAAALQKCRSIQEDVEEERVLLGRVSARRQALTEQREMLLARAKSQDIDAEVERRVKQLLGE